MLATQRKCSYCALAIGSQTYWVSTGTAAAPWCGKPPHVSADLGLLNSALAMDSQGVLPFRAMGGLSFTSSATGTCRSWARRTESCTYCVMLGASSAFDSYMLPTESWCLAQPMTWAPTTRTLSHGSGALEQLRARAMGHAQHHWHPSFVAAGLYTRHDI